MSSIDNPVMKCVLKLNVLYDITIINKRKYSERRINMYAVFTEFVDSLDLSQEEFVSPNDYADNSNYGYG